MTTNDAIERLNALEIRLENEHPVAAPAVPSTAVQGYMLNTDPEVKTFTFGEMAVRMVQSKDNGEPLFCLSDICKGCGLTTPAKTAKQIKEEFGWGDNYTPHLEADKQAVDKGCELNSYPLPTAGGTQDFVMVTEDQMYFVMMRGRSAASKQFRRWICSEVIPSIRRTGSYSVQLQLPTKDESGKYNMTYPEAARMLQEKLGFNEQACAVLNWIIDRAKRQGWAIGSQQGAAKEREKLEAERVAECRLIEADNNEMLKLRQDVHFFKSEADRFKKLDSLKGGVLSVLIQYPNDAVVRMLAKEILGLNEDQN